MKKMYSKEALSDIFQRILKFEQDAKSIYDDCIEKIDDEISINILQSISNEEKGHIEQAKKLLEIIKEDFPRTKSAEDLPQRSK